MWKSIVKDEIWIAEEFLAQEICDELCRRAERSRAFRMAPGETIRSVFDSIHVNPTLYDYTIHYVGIRGETSLQNLYENRLNDFFQSIGHSESMAFDPQKTLQFFLKSFSENSFYEAHVEPVSRYGEFAFIHFLEDCEGGDLVFPDHSDLENWLCRHPEQRQIFDKMREDFVERGEPFRVIGPVTIAPRKNMCLVFRTGSVHWVDPLVNGGGVQRRVVTGWPFVTSELIRDLNSGCGLERHFRDG